MELLFSACLSVAVFLIEVAAYTIHYGQSAAAALKWRVLDSQGKAVASGRIPATGSSGQLKIEAHNWPNGLYWLELSTASARTSARLLIAR